MSPLVDECVRANPFTLFMGPAANSGAGDAAPGAIARGAASGAVCYWPVPGSVKLMQVGMLSASA